MAAKVPRHGGDPHSGRGNRDVRRPEVQRSGGTGCHFARAEIGQRLERRSVGRQRGPGQAATGGQSRLAALDTHARRTGRKYDRETFVLGAGARVFFLRPNCSHRRPTIAPHDARDAGSTAVRLAGRRAGTREAALLRNVSAGTGQPLSRELRSKRRPASRRCESSGTGDYFRWSQARSQRVATGGKGRGGLAVRLADTPHQGVLRKRERDEVLHGGARHAAVWLQAEHVKVPCRQRSRTGGSRATKHASEGETQCSSGPRGSGTPIARRRTCSEL